MDYSDNVIDVAVDVVMTEWYRATRRALARRRRKKPPRARITPWP